MRIVLYGLGVLNCVVFALTAQAGITEQIQVDQLPPKAATGVRNLFHGAELVSATRVREGDREAFTVTIQHKGRTFDVSVGPNGRFVGTREPEFTVNDWPDFLLALAFSLIPGGGGAILALRLIPTNKSKNRPVPLEWLLTWIGAVIGFWALKLVFSGLISSRTPSNLWATNLGFLALGGMSASIVEIGIITIRSIRDKARIRLASILILFIIGGVFAAGSISSIIENRHQRNGELTAQALDYPNNSDGP